MSKKKLPSVLLSGMLGWGTLLCGVLTCGAMVFGQDVVPRRYYPLNTPLPPTGRAGMWAARIGKSGPVKFQQVQVQLPGDGQVTWYEGAVERGIQMPAPAMAGLLVGPVYRLKLSDMPDFPGVQLYPTIEMVDRLHPPAGRETQFPVIVPFTFEELDAAITGRLVTKVIYLEQPNRASPFAAERGKAMPAIRVKPYENPLEVADVHGRPVALVRLGGRVPDVGNPEPGFYGSGAPIQISPVPPPAGDTVTVPEVQRPAPRTNRNVRSEGAGVVPVETPEPQPAATPDESVEVTPARPATQGKRTRPAESLAEPQLAKDARKNAKQGQPERENAEPVDETSSEPIPTLTPPDEAAPATESTPVEPEVKASDFEE